jgi:hypothetical protein
MTEIHRLTEENLAKTDSFVSAKRRISVQSANGARRTVLMVSEV